jgi:hypothetical protein
MFNSVRHRIPQFLVFLAFTGALAINGSVEISASGISSHRQEEIQNKFDPPLNAEERELLATLGSDKAKSDQFAATRQFFRQVARFIAPLPKAINYKPSEHGCPSPSADVDFAYCLNEQEADLLYAIRLECGKKKSGFASKCGQEKITLSPEEIAAAGRPGAVDEAAILSKLTPAATPHERELLRQAAAKPDSEIPRFLATSLYFRQIHKMIAELPSGAKFNPAAAPEPENNVVFDYVDNDQEASWLFDIRIEWAKKKK